MPTTHHAQAGDVVQLLLEISGRLATLPFEPSKYTRRIDACSGPLHAVQGIQAAPVQHFAFDMFDSRLCAAQGE
jgi:hypothetical protein